MFNDTTSYGLLKTLEDNPKALQQALTSSESVLEASKLGQEVGVRTNLVCSMHSNSFTLPAATCTRPNTTTSSASCA